MSERIWLIRHAEAFNTVPESERALDPNPPLTALGERQARELVVVLLKIDPGIVLVSPFLRAVQTIAPYLIRSGKKATVDFRICEIISRDVFASFDGIYPGLYSEEIRRYLDGLDGVEIRSNFPEFPETPEHVECRTAPFWKECLERPVPDIAVVSHGAPLNALVRHILGERELRAGHSNAGVSCFEKKGEQWIARFINSTEHLTETGPPAFM